MLPQQLEAGMLLAGDRGGISEVTGDVTPSSTHPGTTMVETEHGTVYSASEVPVTVLEPAMPADITTALARCAAASHSDSNDREIEALTDAVDLLLRALKSALRLR